MGIGEGEGLLTGREKGGAGERIGRGEGADRDMGRGFGGGDD